MIELSKYTLVILRKDEEFVLYRGQREEKASFRQDFPRVGKLGVQCLLEGTRSDCRPKSA